LTTVKATAEEAMIAETPIAAATACEKLPSPTPSTDTAPARRPWATLRVTT
jgi:hypothetical protein